MNTTPRYCTYSRNRTGINAFIFDAQRIQNKLSAPEFSMVSPSPAQVMLKLERIIAIQVECRKRNYYEVPVRNELRAQVEMMLRQQCMSVNGIAVGDIDILVKSGFALNKEPIARPMPSKGKIENMKDGMEYGQLILTTTDIKDSDYCIAKAVDSSQQVHKATGKPSKIVFENLPVGEEILVYVAGINARGQGEWSNGVPYIISPLTATPPNQLKNNA